MSKSSMEKLVAELAKEWDLPDLAMDKNGFFFVKTADGVFINVDYFEEEDVVSFYTTVAEISKKYRETIYELLLEGNFSWDLTSGATLCIDATEKVVLLTVAMPARELDLRTLLKRFSDFGKVGWFWSQRIAGVSETPTLPDIDHRIDPTTIA